MESGGRREGKGAIGTVGGGDEVGDTEAVIDTVPVGDGDGWADAEIGYGGRGVREEETSRR